MSRKKEWAEKALRIAVAEVQASVAEESRWLSPESGELLEDWAEGTLEDMVEPEHVSGNDQGLGDWVTKVQAQIAAERIALKAMFKVRMGILDSREAGLEWKFGPRLQAHVEAQLAEQGGRRKSIAFAYGSAGFRKSRRLEVHDEEAAIEWAEDNAPDAIKINTSLLKSALPEGVEVPGVELIEGDEFWIRPAKEKRQ